jgi:hypothetical protein
MRDTRFLGIPYLLGAANACGACSAGVLVVLIVLIVLVWPDMIGGRIVMKRFSFLASHTIRYLRGTKKDNHIINLRRLSFLSW